MPEIHWKPSENINSTGRNGKIITSGMAAYGNRNGRVVTLQPINSKGQLANCQIAVDASSIDRVIDMLRIVRDELSVPQE